MDLTPFYLNLSNFRKLTAETRKVRGWNNKLRGPFEHVRYGQVKKAIKNQKSEAMWTPIQLLACFGRKFARSVFERTTFASNCQLHFFTVELTMDFLAFSALSAILKEKLWQESSKVLKICQKDWQGHYSSRILHKILCRATPEMW